MKTLEVQTCAEWQDWLARHYDSEAEVWLIFHKRHTGRQSIDYSDALDVALCFGWIDSLIKRLDDDRYVRKFTPRKSDSKWSSINRTRYAELQAAGRLMPPGLKRPPTAKHSAKPPQSRISTFVIPPYIQQALARKPAVWKFFQSLSPSCRREYIGWIDSAKRQETQLRRLDEAIAMLTAGKRLGLK